MKKQGTLIIACLAAATAGVAIGMLIAPEKGEDLRKNVKKTFGDWASKLSDIIQENAEKAKETANEAKHDVSNASGMN